MTKFYFLLLASSCYLFSCKSASKSYQKGNYADAIELGVKKLQKDPYDGETRDIVQSSYNYAVNEKESQIKVLSNSRDDSRYEKIYQEYLGLQDLYQTIHAYPVPARLIKANDYSEFLETYRDKIVSMHCSRAETLAAAGTKTAYREAYNELQTALRYRPNDFQLKRKADSVYNNALTKVLVIPMEHGGYQFASSQQMQTFQNNILQTLSYNTAGSFVKFYSDWDIRNKEIKPDQTLELQLGRVSIGQPFDNRNTREVSKEVVVKETVYKPDSVIKQYGTVKAQMTATQRTLVSEGDVLITVRDPKGLVLWTDRFTGQYNWKTSFATYTGDERALSDSDRSALSNKETDIPSQDKILSELFRQIQSDLSNRLRAYYNR
ncbi:MAG: hypothetical protein ACXVBR_12770 [Flavisolibacter sp.]